MTHTHRPEHEIVSAIDLDPQEWTNIRQASQQAAREGGYLHVEIRKPISGEPREDRFWAVNVTNPEIRKAAGAPVSGLVDETAGGVVAYVLGPQDRAQSLADVLNAAERLARAIETRDSYSESLT